jgi:cellulose synthase/poly-beta-1,6-N-acetylglucosamine synthase-like glycosyltransferase
LRGDIIVNTDASVRIHPDAVKALVATFADETVGVASGRDVSVDRSDPSSNLGERGYVGYEMWVRALETRVLGIVQASGCLYAARRHIHDNYLPGSLTRDFGSVAAARRQGLRAVSVDHALCFVPRTRSLRREYRRKVRTMTRGLNTVFYWRDLLNPFRHGLYAWMVLSHKLCRWLVPWALLAAGVSLLWLAASVNWLLWALALAAGTAAVGGAGLVWPETKTPPKVVAVPTYVAMSNVAALHSWINLLLGKKSPAWSPTRRAG